MNKSEVVESHQEKNVLAEKNLLFECSYCTFILQLMQTFNFPNQIVMVMEFVQGGMCIAVYMCILVYVCMYSMMYICVIGYVYVYIQCYNIYMIVVCAYI